MTRQTVEVGGRLYTVSPDDAPQSAGRLWGVVGVLVTDEITEAAPRVRLSIETDTPGLSAVGGVDGHVGLAGVPRRLFPALDARDYEIAFTVSGEGYLPRRGVATITQRTDFPEAFTPARVDTALHRRAVTLRGRVMRAGGGTVAPAPGAAVRITGFWRRPRPAHLAPPPAEAANFASLRPGIFEPRNSGVSTLRRRPMAAAGEDKTLLEHVAGGDSRIRLSDRLGLAPGEILRIEPGDPEREEFAVTDSVSGTSNPANAAYVTLAYPAARDHRPAAVVQRVIPQPGGAVNTLTRDAIAGDVCVFLDGLVDLASGDVVEISGGGTAEYHTVSLFAATADGDGYYRLPGLSRVSDVLLEVREGGDSVSPPPEIRPDYSVLENQIDFVIG